MEKKISFNPSDAVVLDFSGVIGIQNFERLCPEVSRRSLQRDLKVMVDMGLLVSEEATN